MSEPKSSFHPLLKPKIRPGTNPMPAAIGNPEAAIERIKKIKESAA
jgi:hypothetical protein